MQRWCRWSEAEVECGHGAVPGSRGRDRGGRHGDWGARAQSRPNTRPGHCPPALAPGAHRADIKYHETGLKGLYPKMWFNKFISHGNFYFCKNYGFKGPIKGVVKTKIKACELEVFDM